MVLYARSDILSAHIGGHNHLRPIKSDGTPVPVWGINCPLCELVLRGDPAWHASRYKIPLSPDQVIEAEDAKEAANRAIQQQQMMLAQNAFSAQMAAKGVEMEDNPDDIAITSESTEPATNVEGDRKQTFEEVASDYAALNKTDLKELARDKGLSVSGTREDLIARIAGFNQED